MEQTLIDLVVDAMDAIEERRERDGARFQGRIALAITAVPPDFWQVEVGDHGCGVAPAIAPRVFRPFVSSKPAGKGTGIGLSIAFGLLRDMNGHIDLAPHRQSGACFRITLAKVAAVEAVAAG